MADRPTIGFVPQMLARGGVRENATQRPLKNFDFRHVFVLKSRSI